MLRLAITLGEPAGIGVDLAVELAQRDWSYQLIIIADPTLIEARAQQLGKSVIVRIYSPADPPTASKSGELWVLPIPLIAPVVAGALDVANVPYVLATLQAAVDGIAQGQFDALITGPIHKGIINEAGIAFTGHTEWLSEQANHAPVVMMLACAPLRVALATTHLPLRDIADAITPDTLRVTVDILYRALVQDFGIATPRILVAGLNPHAGEGGHLGQEEITTITPICREAQAKGWQVSDPLPADTLFSPRNLANTDAFLCMYHDQGLPVLKHIGFGQAVNITLGLPYIRTSVDHGTALELAGTGKAEVGSFIYAIDTAAQMAHARRNHVS